MSPNELNTTLTPHGITNGDGLPSQKIRDADEGRGFLIGFAPAHHLCTS
jgi:hypothetical protein